MASPRQGGISGPDRSSAAPIPALNSVHPQRSAHAAFFDVDEPDAIPSAMRGGTNALDDACASQFLMLAIVKLDYYVAAFEGRVSGFQIALSVPARSKR